MGLLIPNNPHTQAEARLGLLLELEPAHRVFLQNLKDALLFRRLPPVVTTCPPGPFWSDVFVDSGLPWWSFAESMLWHLLVVAGLWSLLQAWAPPKRFQARRSMRSSYVAYYTPSETFSAKQSMPPRARARARGQPLSQRQSPLPVTRESKRSIVTPPDLKLAVSGPPAMNASNSVAPAVPLSATQRSRLAGPSGTVSALGPPPDVNQLGGPRSGLPQASVVAPPPALQPGSGRGAMTSPGTTVIGPPPTVQGTGRKLGDGAVGHSDVVGPSPRLPTHEQRGTEGLAKLAGGSSGSSIVPPPPAVSRSGGPAGGRSLAAGGVPVVGPPPSDRDGWSPLSRGRGPSLSGGGSDVVPPPPSVQAGNSAGGGRAGSSSGTGSFSSDGSQVVPPPPSASAIGNSGRGGRGGSSAGTGLYGGGGSEVVPPPPSVQSAGNSKGGGRGGSLSGTGSLGGGSQVVPPPPSVEGTGNSTGGGRGGPFSGGGSQVAPPAPSVQTAGNYPMGRMGSLSGNGSVASPPSPTGSGNPDETGHSMVKDTPSADIPSSPPAIEKPGEPLAEDVPLRLIQPVMPYAKSTFFSNFEVYLAQRRISKGEYEYIKLVYTFLPYQRRLSEYTLESTKILKLRVVRDRRCDESLLQMTLGAPGQATPNPQDLLDPPTIADDDVKPLPCYTTKADDYRRAISGSR